MRDTTIVIGIEYCRFWVNSARKRSCHGPDSHREALHVPPYPHGDPSIRGVCSVMHVFLSPSAQCTLRRAELWTHDEVGSRQLTTQLVSAFWPHACVKL
jgi:hypothetical protein